MKRFTRAWGRRGITLIELLVVIGIMTSLVAVGGGLMGPQISYFSAKAGVEEIAGALRRAQALARSRGLPYNPRVALLAPGDNNIFFGVAIFRGRYQSDTALPAVPAGYSYMVFGQNDPIEGHRPIPTGGLDTIPVGFRGWVNPLPLDVHITRQFVPPGPLPPTPITNSAPSGVVNLVFYSTGELDMFLGPAGCNSTLAALLRTDTLPLPDTPDLPNSGFAAFSFDAVSETAGWQRIRIRPGGTIDTSAVVPASEPPQTRTGQPF